MWLHLGFFILFEKAKKEPFYLTLQEHRDVRHIMRTRGRSRLASVFEKLKNIIRQLIS